MAAKPRTPVSGPRQIGTVLDWKGKFGWIKPSKPINHPSSSKNGGKVYLAAEDVVEELDGVGATVSFQLYSDKSGLGAADVKMAKGAAAAAPKPVAQTVNGKPATSSAVANYKAQAAKAAAQKANPKAKAKAAAAWPTNAAQGQKRPAPQAADVQQPLAKKGKGVGKDGKGGGKGKSKPAGPKEVIHDEPLNGTIVKWQGKFGWVKPDDEIDHPLAGNHQDLYVSQEDVEEEIEGVGSRVQFMLYADNRGLGAQNVKPA